MKDKSIEILERALAREKAARKAAEQILEEKSRELYFKSEELKELNQKLETLVKEKSSQLKGVFENIVDAYVVMNLFGQVLKMNEAAEELLGYKVSDEINLMELVHKNETEKVVHGFQELIENGSITDFQVKIVIGDSSIRLVHINASLIFDDNDKPIAAQGIVRDITELKILENQKEELLKKLEKSNEELQEYAHIVSHDLKSPLRSIDALVSWLKEDNKEVLDATSFKNLELIQTTLEKMEQLIADVLNYSSVSNNEVVNESVNLQEVVHDIVGLLHIPEHIKLEISDQLPFIKANRARIQQLFQNLLSNAIRFCDKENGLVEIAYSKKKDMHQFAISDNGIGIKKEYHQKIFQIFQTLDKQESSTGIGLSIVKRIVELYNGNIWLESKEGEGTTFFFTLPA